MAGEKNLTKLIRNMKPDLQHGTYVFTTVQTTEGISITDIICLFHEKEGTTLVMERNKADELQLQYDFLAAWITLNIHSSLDATGLTAIFSSALAKFSISCNVISGYYHDHIFIAKKDEYQAIKVLQELSQNFIS